MNTTVVNIKGLAADGFDVYIGRPMAYAKDRRVRRGSMWCNPHRVGGNVSAEDVCREFERYLRAWMKRDPEIVPQLLELSGKRLGCWCKPGPCHGDVLVKILGELEGGA